MAEHEKLIGEILQTWKKWDQEIRTKKLVKLSIRASEMVRINTERMILPDSLFPILIKNLDEDVYFELIFSSLRILIHANHVWLINDTTIVIEKAIKLLYYKMAPISDSASWLLNVIGSKGTERLIKLAKESVGKEKAIAIGVLGRNYHMASTEELSNASLHIFISALYDSDEMVRKWGIYSLIENSPLHPKISESYPDWDFEFVYQQVRPVLIEILLSGEKDDNEIPRKYFKLIERRDVS